MGGNPPNTMSDVGAVEAAAKQMCEEVPNIADALKAYCTAMTLGSEVKVVSADVLTTTGDSNGPKGYAAHDAHDQTELAARAYRFDEMVVLAKVLLKFINAHELPEGADMACIVARDQCRSKGAKPAKMFGRRYLQSSQCWDAIQPSFVAALKEQQTPARMIVDFVDCWSKALSGSDAELAGLVWAVDFKGELARRQAARKAEAAIPVG